MGGDHAAGRASFTFHISAIHLSVDSSIEVLEYVKSHSHIYYDLNWLWLIAYHVISYPYIIVGFHRVAFL